MAGGIDAAGAAALSFRPLAARLWGRIRPSDLRARAVREIEIAPAVVRDHPAAIALPGEFDRARGFYETRAVEGGRLSARRQEEAATRAVRLDDVVLAGGTIYGGLAYQVMRNDGPKAVLRGRPERIDEAAIVSDYCSLTYFGDWLVHGLSQELLAADRGWTPATLARAPWLHEPGYRALVGLEARPVDHARVARLWMVDDRGLNDGRAERLDRLRRRVRAAANGSGPRKVYLARGDMGRGRRIANAAPVEAALTGDGFTVVHPERETPAALARLLGDARVVLGMEGSAMQHAILALPPGAALVNIQPPDRFTAPAKDLCDLLGLPYGYLVADGEGEALSVDPDRLRATLDLVEREGAAGR